MKKDDSQKENILTTTVLALGLVLIILTMTLAVLFVPSGVANDIIVWGVPALLTIAGVNILLGLSALKNIHFQRGIRLYVVFAGMMLTLISLLVLIA